MPYYGHGRNCCICRPICCRPCHHRYRPHRRFPCGCHGFRGFSAGVVLGILFGCI
ncbi:hypothetical protein KHQ81_02760 [Mycoplasmatota bacterium]|nr:hypothetical protein KHQ81_02760 [Mycoplasmatota bacterium]